MSEQTIGSGNYGCHLVDEVVEESRYVEEFIVQLNASGSLPATCDI